MASLGALPGVSEETLPFARSLHSRYLRAKRCLSFSLSFFTSLLGQLQDGDTPTRLRSPDGQLLCSKKLLVDY